MLWHNDWIIGLIYPYPLANELNGKFMNRSTWVLVGTIAAVTTLEASKKRTRCTIQGKVHPAMALRQVWLISNGDTIKTSHMDNEFQVAVKPGRYSIWIDAVAPYQDHRFINLDLTDETTMELGNIELTQ
jgi:hypothetical protein